ncbi:MAG: helix-turn-helix domain-containing protein [Hyphomonadaceae bacterium]|nr:helix-turn-helix domain-containing protein [Hyphomonadaceae bacterium]
MYFSTGSFLPDTRYDAWHDAIGQAYRTTTGAGNFQASLDLRQLGALNCARISQNSEELIRSTKEIDRWGTDECFLITQVAGRSHIEQDGRIVSLDVGDVTLVDSALPCRFRFDGRNVQLCFHIPKDSFKHGELDLRPRLATKPPQARRRILAELMRLSFEEGAGADSQTGRILSAAIKDMAMAAWRDPADGAREGAVRAAASRFEIIQDYILANLHDETLTPPAIALAHSISERQLHRLFHVSGHTVCGWLRQVRLDRCAANLRDRRQASRSITEIALHHDFGDSGQFSRLFRETYGVAPRTYRSQALASERGKH